jgi:hypothetical protein
MYGRGIVCSFYNSVTFKEVAVSHERENQTFSWVGSFLPSLGITYPCSMVPSTTLCLPITFHSKSSFFDPSTQTLCEENPCLK